MFSLLYMKVMEFLRTAISKKGAALLFASAISVNLLFAATYTWNGSTDDDWTNPANWDEAGYPANAADIVVIPDVSAAGGTAPVFDSSVPAYSSVSVEENAALVITGDITLPSLTADGTLTINADLTVTSLSCTNDLTITGNGTLSTNSITCRNLSSTCSITADSITVSGNISGDHTVGTLTISGADNSTSTISGSNTIIDFECTVPGKTLQFASGKTQTVSGTFAVTGEAYPKTTIKSTTADTKWILDAAASSVQISNAFIQDTKTTNVTYLDSGCIYKGTDEYSNENLLISSTYKWNPNATSSDVTLKNNWLVFDGDDYIAASVPPYTENDVISIAQPAAGYKNPDFDTAYTFTAKDLTIEEGAELTISGDYDIKITGDFNNKGTIIFSGDGRTINNTSDFIMDSTQGTVEYKGSSTMVTNFNGTGDYDYYNLVISKTIKFEAGHQIKIKNNFTLSDSCDVTTNGQSLHVENISTIGGNIETEHGQEYNGPVIFTVPSVNLNTTANKGTGAPYQVTFKNTVTGSNTALTLRSVDFRNTASTTGISTLTVDLAASNSGTITTTGAQIYKGAVTNSGTINAANTGLITASITFKDRYNGTGGTLNGNGTGQPVFVFENGDVTFGTFISEGDKIIFSNTGDVNFDSNSQALAEISFQGTGDVTLTNDLSCQGLSISNGTLNAGTDTEIEVNGSWTNTGTFSKGTSSVKISGNISGDNEFNDLELTGVTTSTISGSNIIKNFKCESNGKTIYFGSGKTQTIVAGGTIHIQGSEASPISMLSTNTGNQWNINASAVTNAVNKTFTGVKIQDSASLGSTLSATSSISLGNNSQWVLAQDYVWYGTQNSSWTDSRNWKVLFNGSYSATSDYPGKLSDTDTVKIPNEATASSYDPTFSGADSTASDITLSSLEIGSAGNKPVLTIDDDYNIAISGTLSNYGTVLYSGTGRLINDVTSKPIMDSAKGTVQYDEGSVTISNTSTGDDYYNLIINAAGLTADGAIQTKNDFTINASKSVSAAAYNFTIGNDAYINGTLSCDNLTVSKKSYISANVTTATNQTYTGNSQVKANIVLTGSNVTFTNVDCDTAHSLTVNGKLTSISTGATTGFTDITVNGSFEESSSSTGLVKCSGNFSITGTATFRRPVTAATVSVGGSTTFGYATTSITTTGTQTYTDTSQINSSNNETLTLIAGTAGTPSTITFGNTLNAYKAAGSTETKTAVLTIGNGTIKSNVLFTKSVGATYRLKSITVEGKTEFGTDASNIATLSSQEYNGETKIPSAINFYSKNGTTKGTIDFSGNLINAGTAHSDITIQEGDVTFSNAGTAGSYLGTISVEDAFSVASSKTIYADYISVTGTTSNEGTINTTGLQQYTGAVTNNGTINVPKIATANATAVEFKGGYNGTGNLIGANTSATNLAPDPNIVFSGGTVVLSNFTQNDDNVLLSPSTTCSFNSNGYTFSKIEFSGTGTTTLSAPLTTDNLKLSGGTLSTAKTIIVNDDWTHTGGTFSSTSTVTVNGNVSGSNNFNELILYGNLSGDHALISTLTIEGTGTQGTSTISGSNTITNFNCEVSDKNIKFAGSEKQTITNLKLDGKNVSTPIILDSSDGTSTWQISVDSPSVLYTHIKNSTADDDIRTHLSKNLGNNTNWIFAEDYTWTGNAPTDKTKFDNIANWTIKIGTTSYPAVTYPGESSNDDTVTIPNVTNKPVFSSPHALTIYSLTINENSSLTVTNYDLLIKRNAAELHNYGSIIYNSAARIKNGAGTSVISDANNGKTIFNTGSSTVDNSVTTVSGINYHDLEINSECTLLSTGITVANNFNLTSTGSITGGGTFTVAGTSNIAGPITTTGSQTYQGQITLAAESLVFSTGNTITFTGNVFNKTGITASITINSGNVIFNNAGANNSYIKDIIAKGTFTTISGKQLYANTITVTGTTTNAGTITTTGLQTYNGEVTNNGIIKVPKIATANATAIEFKGGLNGTGTLTGASTSATDLTPNPYIVFSGGNVTFGTFTPNNDNIKFTSTFNGNFDSNNNQVADIYFEGDTTLTNKLTAKNLTLTSGSLSSGTNDITVTQDWKHTAGTFTSNSNVAVAGNISGTNTFNTLTINGTGETKITGTNTINNFVCTTKEKIITFTVGTKQTVNTSLTLNGQEEAKEITLKSSSATYTAAGDQWEIDASAASSIDVKYVKVQNSKSDSLITTVSSVSLGNNINWAIASTFRWTGKDSTDATNWIKPDNWVTVYNSTTYSTHDYPGKFWTNGVFDIVDISTTQVANKWPDFKETASSITLNKISIGTNGSLTLSGTKDLKLTATAPNVPLSNAGKIIYANSGRIKNNATTAVAIMDTSKGLVVYTQNADIITNINTRPTSETLEPSDYYDLTIERDMPLEGCITVGHNFILNSGKSITSPNNSSRFIVRNTASIGGNITTTDLQKYQGAVTLTNNVILKSVNTITFESAATVTGTTFNLTLDTDPNHAASYELKKNITVKTFTANIANGKTLSVPANTTINASAGFTASGQGSVSLGTESSTAQTTITTNNTNISFSGTGTVTLNSGVTLNTGANAGNITITNPLQGKTAGTASLNITAGKGNVSLNSNAGSTTSLGSVTISGAEIALADSKTFTASTLSTTGTKITIGESAVIKLTSPTTAFTINNSDILRIKKGSSIIASGGLTKTGNGLSQIAGSIVTANKTISFNTDTFIDNAATLDTSNNGTVATPTSDIIIGTAALPKDLFISALNGTAAQTVIFKTRTLDVKGNIALFNGNVTLNSNMTAGKDIILLNSPAISSDIYKDNKAPGTITTGNATLFDYHNPLRYSDASLSKPLLNYIDPTTSHETSTKYPEMMPDGITPINHPDGTAANTAKYISTLTGFAGKNITATQNFYDNGVDLKTTSAWTLTIKTNDKASDSFAELYKAEINNCTVKCTTQTSGTDDYAWLSASEAKDGGSNSKNDTLAVLSYTGDDAGTYQRQNCGIAFLYPVLLENNVTFSAAEGRKTGPEIPNHSGTYTVRDNVIRVEFVRSNDHSKTALIENSNNEITKALKAIKLNNKTASIKAEAWIDAECTETTDGKGDIAVFYIQADGITWNLTATGTEQGSDTDSHGVHQTNYNDIYIERIMSDLFYTLTDEHKNRISKYTDNPLSTPSAVEGYIFTATATRCAIAEMHITFTLADFTSNSIYMYFDNPLDFENITWEHESHPTKDTLLVISTPGNTTRVSNDYKVTSVEKISGSDNGIKLNLAKPLSYSMIQYGIVIKYEGSYEFNNKIHSPDSKVVIDGESHCISDVITDCVDVQYAYDNRNDTYIESTGGIAPADSIVMRDFTGEGKHNKVFADKNITLVTKDKAPKDGNNNAAAFNYKLIADISPNENSIGKYFPSYTGHKTRFWFPEGNNPVNGFAPALNNSSTKVNSAANSDLVTQTVNTENITYLFHNFSEETPCLNWQSGSNVRFLFEVLNNGTPYSINHRFDTTETEVTPLYCARLKDPSDITSIDLWSFLISEPQRQRGGVTIYSNVINAGNKDFCTLEVNMPKDGNLRVLIMTADGNIVKYLENGRKPSGLHYYYWNGTNNAGDTVARGIYFIRVVGPGFEETRKVMVVK